VELRNHSARRIEANFVLFAGDGKRNVAKRLHGLSVVVLDAFVRLPRSFVAVLVDDAVRMTEKCDHALFCVAACDPLPWPNVAPIFVLSGDKPERPNSTKQRHDCDD
jgi:hypothetical protein